MKVLSALCNYFNKSPLSTINSMDILYHFTVPLEYKKYSSEDVVIVRTLKFSWRNSRQSIKNAKNEKN